MSSIRQFNNIPKLDFRLTFCSKTIIYAADAITLNFLTLFRTCMIWIEVPILKRIIIFKMSITTSTIVIVDVFQALFNVIFTGSYFHWACIFALLRYILIWLILCDYHYAFSDIYFIRCTNYRLGVILNQIWSFIPLSSLENVYFNIFNDFKE